MYSLVLIGLAITIILVGGLVLLLVQKTEKPALIGKPASLATERKTENLTYTISNCKKSEPENEIVKVYDDKIVFDIDIITTNCDYKIQMKKEENTIKLLLQGEDCMWSVGCYNIKGEIESLEKGKYILEFQGFGVDKIIKKEVLLN